VAESKTIRAARCRESALHLRNDARPASAVIAREYQQQANELMAVDPTSFEIQSGEVMHSPCSEVNIYSNPLSDAPDSAAIEASTSRTELANQVDCIGMALDAANSINASNSLEKMLGHQMAACHKVAFDLMKEAQELDKKYNMTPDTFSIIQSRKLNSANRLMQTYQQAMTTLSKVRNAGKQTMVVQHVQINEGGQAIVAGGDAGRTNGEK